MSVFFGTLMIFILPPIQAPDENSHFIRSVMVAYGKLEQHEESGQIGQHVPISLSNYVDAHGYLKFNPDRKYPYASWYRDSHQKAEFTPTEFLHYSTQDASPLLYLPQALGIRVAQFFAEVIPLRPFDFSWAAAQYGARLGNLVMFTVVGVISLAYVSRYRLVAFASLTLPMVMQQSASSSYDATTLAVAVGFFALLTGLLERQRAPRKVEIALLIICAFLLGHAKAAYAPLLLSAVLFYKIVERRELVYLLGGMFAASLVGFLITTLVLGVPDNPVAASYYAAQIDWLKEHWWDVPRLIAYSTWHNQALLTISYFANFGWLDTNWALPMVILPAGCLMIAVLADGSLGKGLFGAWGTSVVVAGLILSITAFTLAMYIYWTSSIVPDGQGIGAPVVQGVQGRYFLPLTVFGLAVFAALPDFIAKRIDRMRNDAALALVTLSTTNLTLMLFAILVRYWVPSSS
ncbi:DUF2142 domain-containing protein [Hyphomonas sp. CACIAM 19H1]|uniref:DUF2142 domain-containing protein n=1 Tax=Hyphomonas sp. CACIAM 19H1 TaxID=1873716 RepID=UPI001F278677|nr:DUF2142 domain-containing protein [Hyphomonas sp. CACIAM 19H1]